MNLCICENPSLLIRTPLLRGRSQTWGEPRTSCVCFPTSISLYIIFTRWPEQSNEGHKLDTLSCSNSKVSLILCINICHSCKFVWKPWLTLIPESVIIASSSVRRFLSFLLSASLLDTPSTDKKAPLMCVFLARIA